MELPRDTSRWDYQRLDPQLHRLFIAHLGDADQHRAFVACQGNNKLIVMDMPSMKVTSTHDVGSGPDVLALDPALHLVYVAAENGPLAVFTSDSTGVQRVAFESAGPNAHSVAVAPDTH